MTHPNQRHAYRVKATLKREESVTFEVQRAPRAWLSQRTVGLAVMALVLIGFTVWVVLTGDSPILWAVTVPLIFAILLLTKHSAEIDAAKRIWRSSPHTPMSAALRLVMNPDPHDDCWTINSGPFDNAYHLTIPRKHHLRLDELTNSHEPTDTSAGLIKRSIAERLDRAMNEGV